MPQWAAIKTSYGWSVVDISNQRVVAEHLSSEDAKDIAALPELLGIADSLLTSAEGKLIPSSDWLIKWRELVNKVKGTP